MSQREKPHGTLHEFRSKIEKDGTISRYAKGNTVSSQGDRANVVFMVHKGTVKLSVVSRRGKEAVIGVVRPGSFFGEGCLAGQPVRIATATAISECTIVRFDKALMIRLLRQETDFADSFLTHLLSRNIRLEDDLVDQLFNSSEKRLARALLLLANFGKEGKMEPVVPKITQEMLARIVGTTRSRVSFFMNRFRKLGLIEYNGGLKIHSSLLTILLRE